MGAFLPGAVLLDLSSLNNRLRANGYDELSTLGTLVAGEGHALFRGGFMIGAWGGGIFYPDGAGPNGFQSHWGGGFGMFDMGYAFVRTTPFLLTLTGGVGGYGMSLELSNEQSADFDEVLADPKRGASLGSGGLLAGVTLGFDGRIPIARGKDGRRAYFVLGARVGGLFGMSLGGWGLGNGAQANDGPSFGLRGGFLTAAIGFGGGLVEPERSGP